MTRLDRGTLSRASLYDYFRNGAKPRDRWRIGLEVEKLGIDPRTGRAPTYGEGAPDLRSVIEEYQRTRGGDPVFEGEHLVGLDGDWGAISLEPGGQFEWSARPMEDLDRLEEVLQAHLEAMVVCSRRLGLRWLDVALHPDLPLDAMPWMPKARYAIMRRLMAERGRLAHRMMTQTASVQCAFDYAGPEDWARKFRASALMTPLAVALFANSRRLDGTDTGYRSYRQAIWRETDPDRCDLPAVVFEPGFGLERWTDWVCDVPTLFLNRDGGLRPTGGIPFRALLSRSGCEAVSMEDWELHLSTIFTEVRSYTYIETRCADLQPDPLILAVPSFWTGILYDEGALDRAIGIGSRWDDAAAWRRAMEAAARDGLDGTIDGRPLREAAADAMTNAARALRSGATGAGSHRDPARALEALARHLGLPSPGASR